MENRTRVDVADALRAIAVLGIVLLHCIEHYNYYIFPEASSPLLAFSDRAVWDGLFFLFGGKAYGMFALLFGFTFWIQDSRQTAKGKDFRARFVWRMALLALFGFVNAAFYPGEVLVMYSIVGLTLPLVARLPDKWVLGIAMVLLAQPDLIARLVATLANPEAPLIPIYWHYWAAIQEGMMSQDFWTTIVCNLTDGQLSTLTWSLEYGRIVQAPALMMIGMLIGRRGLLLGTEANLRFWTRAALVGILVFFPLYGLANMAAPGSGLIGNPTVAYRLEMILSTWHKLAFMVFMVGTIIVLFYRNSRVNRALMWLAPYGRMSMTMYISQSMIGSAVFFSWGLGLGPQMGYTASLAVAVCIFALQYTFAVWWLKKHSSGPLETLWKKGTWLFS